MNDTAEPAGMDTDKILAQFDADYRSSRSHFKEWRAEARTLYDFEAGRQWEAEDEAAMQESRRPMVTFNLFSKFIDAVVGLQINNRQEIRFFPRNTGAAGQSDLANGCVKWNRDLSDAETEETDAFRDLVLTGMGWIEHRLEDSTDPEGYIAQERRDPLEMYPDPKARQRNLSDARFVIRVVPMSVQEYKDRFGQEYLEETETDEFAADDDSDPEIISKPEDYDGDDAVPESVRGKVRVAQYQWWTLEDAYLVDVAGQRQTINAADWPQFLAIVTQGGVQYTFQKIRTRRYYQAFICGKQVHEANPLPTTSGFTFKCLTGKRDRNRGTWSGIGRNAKDPNLWVNKFFSSIIWQLSINPKGGLLAEIGAFEDPKKAEASWANPGAITFVNDGAIAEGRVREKPSAVYPQGMDRLMTFSLQALPETTGLNMEIMGLADRVQAGVVEAQRKQSAMAIIAWAFDAMRLYYKQSGRLILEWSRDFLADGRLIRIAGEAGQQYVPLFRDKLQGTFDIVVDEAPTSTNMRERTWSILREIIPMAIQAGVNVPREILDYAPIPEELAAKWRKSMEPSPEQQAQQKQQMEAAVREVMAKIAKDESQAQLNLAKAQEITEEAPFKTLKTAAEAGRAQAGTPTPAAE